MSRSVYLSLGSNITPEIYIPQAIEALKNHFTARRVSSIYETDPVGPVGKSRFWNLAVEILTDLDRESIHLKLREIETALGRTRNADKFSPRTIDIDILPQPDYQNHFFIVIPLAEIAPDLKEEVTGKTFGELAEGMADDKLRCRKITLKF